MISHMFSANIKILDLSSPTFGFNRIPGGEAQDTHQGPETLDILDLNVHKPSNKTDCVHLFMIFDQQPTQIWVNVDPTFANAHRPKTNRQLCDPNERWSELEGRGLEKCNKNEAKLGDSGRFLRENQAQLPKFIN